MNTYFYLARVATKAGEKKLSFSQASEYPLTDAVLEISFLRMAAVKFPDGCRLTSFGRVEGKAAELMKQKHCEEIRRQIADINDLLQMPGMTGPAADKLNRKKEALYNELH